MNNNNNNVQSTSVSRPKRDRSSTTSNANPDSQRKKNGKAPAKPVEEDEFDQMQVDDFVTEWANKQNALEAQASQTAQAATAVQNLGTNEFQGVPATTTHSSAPQAPAVNPFTPIPPAVSHLPPHAPTMGGGNDTGVPASATHDPSTHSSQESSPTPSVANTPTPAPRGTTFIPPTLLSSRLNNLSASTSSAGKSGSTAPTPDGANAQPPSAQQSMAQMSNNTHTVTLAPATGTTATQNTVNAPIPPVPNSNTAAVQNNANAPGTNGSLNGIPPPIQLIPPPTGGFPSLSGITKDLIHLGQDPAQVNFWTTQVPGAKVIAYKWLSSFHTPDQTARAMLISNSVIAISGGQAPAVFPPLPAQHVPQGSYRSDPTSYLVSGITQATADSLIQARAAMIQGTAVFFVPFNPPLSPFLAIIEDWGAPADTTGAARVVDHIRQQINASHPSLPGSLFNWLMINGDPIPGETDLSQHALATLASITATPVITNNNHSTQISWAINIDPPVTNPARYAEWKNHFLELNFNSNTMGAGNLRSIPLRCNGCKVPNHTINQCDYLLIPGWNPPKISPHINAANRGRGGKGNRGIFSHGGGRGNRGGRGSAV